MSDSSNIEWTDATWNPVVGCSRVSAGCDRCYAVGMTRRLEGMSKAGGFGLTGHRAENYRGLTIELPQVAIDRGVGVNGRHFNGEVRCVESALPIPLGWKKPKRIFVNSMSDLFHPKVPFEFIDRVFAVMAMCPLHTFQVLTKRPERMAEYLDRGPMAVKDAGLMTFGEEVVFRWPLPNVWLGTSCEDQAAANERIPHLLRCPAAVRFLSCEPLLAQLKILPWLRHGPVFGKVDWVIVGGESGPGARRCDVSWIRSIIRQCADAGVPCFVKQLGGHPTESGSFEQKTGPVCGMELRDRKGGDPSEWPHDLCVRQMPAGAA